MDDFWAFCEKQFIYERGAFEAMCLLDVLDWQLAVRVSEKARRVADEIRREES